MFVVLIIIIMLRFCYKHYCCKPRSKSRHKKVPNRKRQLHCKPHTSIELSTLDKLSPIPEMPNGSCALHRPSSSVISEHSLRSVSSPNFDRVPRSHKVATDSPSRGSVFTVRSSRISSKPSSVYPCPNNVLCHKPRRFIHSPIMQDLADCCAVLPPGFDQYERCKPDNHHPLTSSRSKRCYTQPVDVDSGNYPPHCPVPSFVNRPSSGSSQSSQMQCHSITMPAPSVRSSSKCPQPPPPAMRLPPARNPSSQLQEINIDYSDFRL